MDSIWQSDRIIEKTPNLETMSVMAALAGGSKRLKFGMNVASMALRDPVLMAKACATIDVLSNGRLLPAFGVGSALAGVAGVIAGPVLTTFPGMATVLGSIVFVIVVIGGLGSLAGALIASLLIGLLQSYAIASNLGVADLLNRRSRRQAYRNWREQS